MIKLGLVVESEVEMGGAGWAEEGRVSPIWDDCVSAASEALPFANQVFTRSEILGGVLWRLRASSFK